MSYRTRCALAGHYSPHYYRMMIEAQEIFGLDFDPAEFDQLAKDGMLSGDEDQDEEVGVWL